MYSGGWTVPRCDAHAGASGKHDRKHQPLLEGVGSYSAGATRTSVAPRPTPWHRRRAGAEDIGRAVEREAWSETGGGRSGGLAFMRCWAQFPDCWHQSPVPTQILSPHSPAPSGNLGGQRRLRGLLAATVVFQPRGPRDRVATWSSSPTPIPTLTLPR